MNDDRILRLIEFSPSTLESEGILLALSIKK